MGAPSTLDELGRWAKHPAIRSLVSRPWPSLLGELQLDEADAKVFTKLCTYGAVRCLGDLLRSRSADKLLASIVQPARALEVVSALHHAVCRLAQLAPEDDGPPPASARSSPAPPTPAAPPRPAAPVALPVAPVPTHPAEARRWAELHGVVDRLADPASVLRAAVYEDGATLIGRTIGDLLVAPISPRKLTPAQRRDAWAAEQLATAARAWLFEVARLRAVVLTRREELAKRAAPPSEPALAALVARLQALRAELAPQTTERGLGTYFPSPATVEEGPPRIVHREAAHLLYGVHELRATILVADEPLRVACACPEGQLGACAHAVSALDSALEMLHDPASPERATLAWLLGVPPWRRFVVTLDAELAARAPPASSEEARLAWRVWGGPAGQVGLEPVIQTRLKSGGFSSGHRTTFQQLDRRRELLADPHDARAYEAFTRGLEESGGQLHGAPSRARMARTLGALIGHPRVYFGGSGATPAQLSRARLEVQLEPAGDELTMTFSLGERRFTAAELGALAGAGHDLIAVDPDTASVVLATLDAPSLALLRAAERHPARFPRESHDALLAGLGRLQESVALTLPPALAGEPVAADGRLLLRLTPLDPLGLSVEALVRPVEGGPAFQPGQGPETVFHARGGQRFAALRDRAAEISTAAALLERLAPSHGEAFGFSFQLHEEAALDLVAALPALGEAVVVEWPEPERRLSLAGQASRKELRVRISADRDWFGVEGEVEVDGARIPLAELLAAVRRGRRYLQLGPGRFALIEEELRRRARAVDDVLHRGRHGLEVALPGAALLAELVDEPGALQAAARFRDLVARIDAARTLEPVVPGGLRATLRPYQREGYAWLARLAAWGSGACLADDMGLGKTVQALALLLSRAERGPALVIAPTSVGPNWLREAERFAPGLAPVFYRGPGRAALLDRAGPGQLFVTSYALAVRDAEALAKVRFAVLVLDEAQAIKNAVTRRARALRGLDAELTVALTGTPVENHLGELWSLMRFVAPGLLGSWEHFRGRFAGPIERAHDAERAAALARLVRPFLLRRTKAEVAPELPPRIEVERFVDLSPAEQRLYDEARREALEALTAAPGDGRFALLAALTRLRRLACHPRLLDDRCAVPSSKLAALLDLVRELREEGHRALIFSQFTSHLALVREALDAEGARYEYLDGATPTEERARRIDAFQAGRSELFLISLKAGGTGLNLTSANHVIHLDPWWNPAVEDQATDRAHRIGQTRAVTVVRLIARRTIEEAVLSLHAEKRALAATVFDEEGAGPLSTEDLAALIQRGAGEEPTEEENDAAGDEEVGGGEAEGEGAERQASLR
jgi:superfamily II DNA or RNA helicase